LALGGKKHGLRRGDRSRWAPEHSHIPLSRRTPFPQGGDLPKKYSQPAHGGSGMMILRAALAAALTLGLLAGPLTAEAPPAAKVWRIGLLDYAAPNPASAARWKALRERLRELGYVEGQNVVFESRWEDGQVGRFRSLAAELIDAKVDILVTAGVESARAAKQATSSIPIVTATGGDLVEQGLVAGLARPGGNVTGVTSLTSQLIGKRLELLQQLIPRASRVAILRHPENPGSALSLRDAESGAG